MIFGTGRDTPPGTGGLARPSTEGARAGCAGARVEYLQYLHAATCLHAKMVIAIQTVAVVGWYFAPFGQIGLGGPGSGRHVL